MGGTRNLRHARKLGAIIVGIAGASCSHGRRPVDARVDHSDDSSALLAVVRTALPPPEQVSARDALANQQARAAVALLSTGASDTAWTLLRHSEDPTRRSYLVHMLATHGVRAEAVLARLRAEPDTSARRALILSLGGYSEHQIGPRERARVVAQLLTWYRADPDPGIHGAIDWLLRYGVEGPRARALQWNEQATLARIDGELAGKPQPDKRWHVTREGLTMVTMPGPAAFRMGSPAYERGRASASDSPGEPLHAVRIPHSFAIASKDVTVAQFQRFLDANPDIRQRHAYDGRPGRMAEVMKDFSPDSTGPQIAVTWYEAAMYCNWLSRQEGLPASEWVYPERAEAMRSGMKLPEHYLHRTGYRLPTEAEWEYAARAGATTPHFFGVADSLLPEYAWYSHYPQQRKTDPIDPRDPNRTWPVGQLEPNDFGLFDIYGNVWEWTQDRVARHTTSAPVTDGEDTVLVVVDSVARTRRSGGFPYPAEMMRSAERGTIGASPAARRDNVGFRVAQSVR